MPDSDDCPPSDELAALVEGSRPHDGWRALIDHLRRCPSCYSVFLEARKLRREAKKEGDPGH